MRPEDYPLPNVSLPLSLHAESNMLVTNSPSELNGSYPEYYWLPEVLAKATHSSEYLSHKLHSEIRSGLRLVGKKGKDYINRNFVQNGLGIDDATDAELEQIVKRPIAAVYYFANMINQRAQIGWSTHGHSAVDVNIYGTASSDDLHGNHENTDVGKFLRGYLNVDVEEITRELKQSMKINKAGEDSYDWTGRMPSEEDISLVLGHNEKLYGEAPVN
jgi:alkaline phosphatase